MACKKKEQLRRMKTNYVIYKNMGKEKT